MSVVTSGDDEYMLLKKIDDWGYSKAYLAKHTTTNQLYMLKLMINSDSEFDTIEIARNEAKTLENLSHPNILNLLDYSESAQLKTRGNVKDVNYMLFEHTNEGDLFDLVAMTGKFSEKTARFYFRQICEALAYLNAKGISHRDMKLGNIKLDPEFNLKIYGFGFISNEVQNDSIVGTRDYMAPELHTNRTYNGSAVDLFSAGIILFMMVSQQKPFQEAKLRDSYYKCISNNREDLFWKLHSKEKPGGLEYYSFEIRDLITMMLQFDPIDRPSIAEVMEHPWYQGEIPSRKEIMIEFEERYQILKKEMEEESKEDITITETETPISNQKQDHDQNQDQKIKKMTRHKVHKNNGDDVDSESDLTIPERHAASYVPEFKTYSQFFSTSDIDELFKTLALFCEKVTPKFNFSVDQYSVELNIVEEQSKVEMIVNILKVGFQDKFCIKAVKQSGDRTLFNKIYSQLESFFGDHANATDSIDVPEPRRRKITK